jgi:hypothetical protein
MEDPFEIPPLPVEQEFRAASVKHRLQELNREELEVFLSEALVLLTQLAHQVRTMRDYITGKTM